jgi:dTMP kinase
MHDGWSILPDRTFLLVLSIDDALARLADKSGREHFERREVLEAVQNNYLAYARREPSRFVIVDALKEKEEIATFVAEGIRLVVRSGKTGRKQ